MNAAYSFGTATSSPTRPLSTTPRHSVRIWERLLSGKTAIRDRRPLPAGQRPGRTLLSDQYLLRSGLNTAMARHPLANMPYFARETGLQYGLGLLTTGFVHHWIRAARIICCVRHVPWVVDSLERLVQANPLEPSRIFGFDAVGTVYTRYEMLAGVGGLVGYSWNALRQAFYGAPPGQIMLLSYETLAADPARAMAAVYDFIGAPVYAHDFENVEIETEEFDQRLGAPGLHRLRPRISFERRETILPPDLFERVAKDSFWIEPAARHRGVPVI